MTTRTPCSWQEKPGKSKQAVICQVCKGHVLYEGGEICPFMGLYGINPALQHLVSAEERLFCIQQQAICDRVRECES